MNTFSAIRVLQPLGEFYLTALPADFLLKVGFTNLLTLKDDGKYDGNQRYRDKNRIKEISRYLQTQDAVLPGTIILAANCTPDGIILDPNDEEHRRKRWNVKPQEGTDREVVSIEIPTNEQLAAVVDGQHRLWGFQEEDLPDDLKTTSLPCAVFIDLPTPQQAYVFATINFNQKPVSKSLSYNLFGYNLDNEPEHSWSPDKMAVFFTRKLNNDSDSPFRDHIKVAAQDERILDDISKARQKEWSVSTATIVEGILSLISKNPKQDRVLLHQEPMEMRSRKRLQKNDQGEQPPFRDTYLAEDRDIVIYKTLLNFFNAANEIFWTKLQADSKSLIRKTAGVQALFQVLKACLKKQLDEKNLRRETWMTILKKAGSLDFENINVFESSGRGRARIRDAILATIDPKTLDKITDDQFRAYLQPMVTAGNNEATMKREQC